MGDKESEPVGDLRQWFVTLRVVNDLLATLREQTMPDGVSADTALAIGHAMGTVAKAKALLDRDLARPPAPGTAGEA